MSSKNTVTQNTYNKVAQQYWEKAAGMDQYNTSYDAFCKLLPQNATVFEMGCGPGNVTQYLLNKRPDLHYTASDLAPNMLVLAKKNSAKAHFLQLDCREIATLNQSYDAIMGAFVLPYLNKREISILIKDCSKILNPKGTLYISTMEGNDAQSGFEYTSFSRDDQVYIHYHQEDFITQCLIENGFEIVQLFKQPCHEPNGHIYNDMLFLVQKLK